MDRAKRVVTIVGDSHATVPSVEHLLYLVVMAPKSRVLLIAGGYITAATLAIAAVLVNQALTPADAQASAGMAAFGDAILFCVVFAAVASIPTAYAVYLLIRRQ